MKALSLHQPWASLVAAGVKTFETRSWRTDWRGRLAIHATLAPIEPDYLEPALCEAAEDAFGVNWSQILPHGSVVAICILTECHHSDDFTLPAEMAAQYELGDFSAGRYVWEMHKIRRLQAPIEARGRQGMWNWTPPSDLIFWPEDREGPR